MLRNIFWMGLSSVVRLGAHLVLFILIARALEPEEFGHYMFWYGSTYLYALIANYGLGTMLLKEVAQHPENVANVLGESLGLRLVLSSAIFLCALGCSVVVDRPELLLLLLLTHFVEAASEIFYSAYRALGHYALESWLATCVSVIQLFLIVVAVTTGQDVGGIAIAHLAGKVVQLALVLPISRRILGNISLSSPRAAYKLAMQTKAYAADMFLGNVFGHIDSVVLRICVGIDIVGIYQSGMRIFQGAMQALAIFANVFLPEMARQTHQDKKSRIAIVLQVTFSTYGMIVGLILAYFPRQIISLSFGESYGQLSTLLPLFGLLFFVRFFVAAWGVILSAEGCQGYRAKSTGIHLIFALIAGSYLAYNMQAQGWLIALILANLLLGILQMRHVLHLKSGISPVVGICMLIFGGILLAPPLSRLWT